MKGKNILITGASRGIGARTAEYLSEQGANVVLVARDEDRLKKLQEKLVSKSHVIICDLQNLDDIGNIFDECAMKGIKLHGMVYCAGVSRDVPVKNNDIEWMEETFLVNYMAFVECAKYFMKKKYSENGSSIIAVSSIATVKASPGMCTYASSKAALETAVKVMSKEAVKRRIRVNAVAPSCVDTEMIREATFLSTEDIHAAQPFGIIEPVYVSYMIEYLLSDKGKYITGAIVPIYAGNA